MGCIQSKHKHQNISPENGNGVTKVQNNPMWSEDSQPVHDQGIKAPRDHDISAAHTQPPEQSNGGTLDAGPKLSLEPEKDVKRVEDAADIPEAETANGSKLNTKTIPARGGRISTKGADVYIPEEFDRVTNGANSTNNGHAKDNGNIYMNDEQNIGGLSTENTAFNTNDKLETEKEIQKVEKKQATGGVEDILSSVFIPDSNDVIHDVTPDTVHQRSRDEERSVELDDIEVGEGGMDEVTMVNQTMSAADGQESGVTEVETADGYTYKENTTTNEEVKPSVRYQNKDGAQYGLPEGLPGPAPPKSRKADLIKPNAFTIVDKIVEQTPDGGVGSVPKLATYLSGEIKLTELKVDDDDVIGAKDAPPPKPATSKKKDLIPNMDMFKKVEDNAKHTPESVRMSVEKLAAHLLRGASTDLEKVRSFYYWICQNISYMFDSGTKGTSNLRYDAVSTLRQGRGSYVNLMAGLCKEAGIPVVTIPGCSKGLRHQPDKQFKVSERNHSWNAVFIVGEWRFLDCTWGSGYLDAQGKFQRQFDEFWFLTDPEVFIYDHYPTHPIWQLLEEPVDIEAFNVKPSLTEKSREFGFKLISHRSPIINVEDEVTITFGTDNIPLANITADLRNEDGREVNRHRCMQRKDETTFEVRVVPPASGEYRLILYGKAKEYKHAKYRKLMEYTLRCDHVFSDKITFPMHMKVWGVEPNYAELGFAGSVHTLSVFTCDSNSMTLSLEQTRKVPITVDLMSVANEEKQINDYTMVTATGNTKIIHVRFPVVGFYKLDVYAEQESEKYEFTGSFMIQCTQSNGAKLYPKFNADSVSKQVCELLEPMDRELPENTIISFKIRSSGLKNAMLGVPMEKDYGSRLEGLGELKKDGNVFSGQVKTPKKGQAVLLSGCAAPPHVFWSRMFEFVTV